MRAKARERKRKRVRDMSILIVYNAIRGTFEYGASLSRLLTVVSFLPRYARCPISKDIVGRTFVAVVVFSNIGVTDVISIVPYATLITVFPIEDDLVSFTRARAFSRTVSRIDFLKPTCQEERRERKEVERSYPPWHR